MQPEIDIKLLHETNDLISRSISWRQAFYYISKRVLDIFVSLVALLILSPFLVLVAIMIKLDSPGPVIFTQDRVGSRRRSERHLIYWQKVTFRCYKFRTMVCNADQSLHKSYIRALISNDCKNMVELQGENTQIRKLTHDPRITRIGKILRKFSIDEIPQFYNVLKGEMSLVGPRPAIPYEVEMYKPWHYQRLHAKPGITGYWQVTARSTASFDEMIYLDLQYIDRQSFWFDLEIILKTPIAVLSCRGAQ